MKKQLAHDFMPPVLSFLEKIGIFAEIVPVSGGFLEKIKILNGGLRIDPDCSICDILHEAGHLAIIPNRYRSRFSVNADDSDVWDTVMAEIRKANLDPDHRLCRAVIQCSDQEATAWAWAAGLAIGVDHDLIIEDNNYPDDNGIMGGEYVRLAMENNQWPGINGLMHSGMCDNPRRPDGFPKMKKWLQDADID